MDLGWSWRREKMKGDGCDGCGGGRWMLVMEEMKGRVRDGREDMGCFTHVNGGGMSSVVV